MNHAFPGVSYCLGNATNSTISVTAQGCVIHFSNLETLMEMDGIRTFSEASPSLPRGVVSTPPVALPSPFPRLPQIPIILFTLLSRPTFPYAITFHLQVIFLHLRVSL